MTTRRLLTLVVAATALWLGTAMSRAQEQRPWEEVWHAVTGDDPGEADEATLEDNYELLAQLAEHPLDLNSATRDDLEQLPFLTAQQVMDLQEYLYHYGPMRSMGELRMIRSMDHRQLTLLPLFTYVGTAKEERQRGFPRLDTIARHGRHMLTATARLPFYERRGDRNGYLGYRYRHSLRYEFNYGDRVRAGLTGAQDAGEPFFAGRNRWGYDAWSGYAMVSKLGPVQTAIVGRYKVAAGMGLVLNTSFRLGKAAAMQSLGRQASTLRPHASRSEADYFQGAAATIGLTRKLRWTAFVSHRPADATLNSDGTAATLLTDGYHRTPAEMEKKHNLHQTAAGGRLAFAAGALHLGANAVWTHLSRRLEPDRSALYRRHYAHGSDLTNASVDYRYYHHRLVIGGETAVSQQGALATVNTLSYQPSGALSLMAVQRYYSYRYTGLYAHSFGDNARAQNESGLFVGATWEPARRLTLRAYADYAYHPWARYQVSEASRSWDFFLQGDWRQRRWQWQARARVRLRQRDNAEATALEADRDCRCRLAAVYQAVGWSARTQADLVSALGGQADRGWMLSEHVGVQRRRWSLSATAALFSTDSYASRIFIYERQIAHEFSFPSFYGEGARMALLATADMGARLRLSTRLAWTGYFDRSVIGSGLQQIGHSHQTDLDVQLRWKF